MSVRDVFLTEHFDRFIDDRVSAGRFGNASEAVAEGMRLLEERESREDAQIARFRIAAAIGFGQLDCGEGIEFDSMDDLAAYVGHLAD